MDVQKTILCVDDDPVARLVIRRFIEEIGGYVSVESANGKDCSAYVDQHKVDLVILDYNLGDIDGLNLSTQISASNLNSDTPIIISSVINRTDLIKKCNNVNVFKVVQKPYLFDSFKDDLKTLFQSQ